VNSSIKSILLSGSSESSINGNNLAGKAIQLKERPILIEPDAKDQVFMNFIYEKNPLDSSSTQRVILKSNSLKLSYHAITINNIVYFFRSARTIQSEK
jgi:hypothetical protein